ncbi:unnamed protein product [Sphenostylis stenocarpa]|uniref:adenylate kinase n=1 Tax=Sphenostylis stenocarpa TaxID=92480 RepID=A0AA86TB80_9FABA|nr:unnamed protein product [Sphenostylis stenocarpa]
MSSSFNKTLKVNCSASEPLKVMISGAPASGKGTQCELIVQKFGLVHISTGDLLRAEVAAGTEIGKKAKEFMNAGHLVPDEIMVAARLSREDAKQNGWLLDGYPRSLAQAQSLEKMQIRPDVYIVLDVCQTFIVPDEILIDRCVGRRLDPVTGNIYHLKFFPPETEEIKARLITRPDDTEEKVKSRLNIYKQNAEAISSSYSNITHKIDGGHSKEAVFKEIESLLSQLQQDKVKIIKSGEKSILDTKKGRTSLSQDKWRGIPTRLNNIPHSREIRKYFYDDVLQATERAINDGKTRLKSIIDKYGPLEDVILKEALVYLDIALLERVLEGKGKIELAIARDGWQIRTFISTGEISNSCNLEANMGFSTDLKSELKALVKHFIMDNRWDVPFEISYKSVDHMEAVNQVILPKIETPDMLKWNHSADREFSLKETAGCGGILGDLRAMVVGCFTSFLGAKKQQHYALEDQILVVDCMKAVKDLNIHLPVYLERVDIVSLVDINIPELNPEMDVYRIGTLMELVRALALSFADDGKRVKVCVQGSMGDGALAGMPLQLAGTRKILEFMDWGDYGAKGTFINIGSIGAAEVEEQDDMYILVAPQNAVGNCIIDDLRAMTNAAEHRPVILINARLKDLPGSSGIMQTMGRDQRLKYAASFESCYLFRLLYYAGTQYPIMGAIRMTYPYQYELYKRVDESPGKEKYVILSTFSQRPTTDEINDAFQGKPSKESRKTSGIWLGLLEWHTLSRLENNGKVPKSLIFLLIFEERSQSAA